MSKPPARSPRPPRPPARRAAPLAAAALLGTVLAPAAASVPPERVALQARVDAVRAALAVVPEAAAENGADVSATAWLLAQATNWTNWPKWSKWSNWANK